VTALRQLRAELTAIFMAAAEGDEQAAVDRLNALLIRHPVHPVISGHDSQRWHLHLSDGGTVADQYAAGAVFGLATFVTQYGADRLGICTLAACHGVFIDASTNSCRRYCSDHCASRQMSPHSAPGSGPAQLARLDRGGLGRSRRQLWPP